MICDQATPAFKTLTELANIGFAVELLCKLKIIGSKNNPALTLHSDTLNLYLNFTVDTLLLCFYIPV